MDIFDYALKMEKDGEEFYRQIADRTNDKGLKCIMTMLADYEVEHYKIIQKIRDNQKCEVGDSEVLAQAKNIFSDMDPEKTFTAEQKQLDLYRKARELEKQSMDFYTQKAKETTNSEHKILFEQLAREESKHFSIMDNLVEFIAKPEKWVEFAEWYHRDEY